MGAQALQGPIKSTPHPFLRNAGYILASRTMEENMLFSHLMQHVRLVSRMRWLAMLAFLFSSALPVTAAGQWTSNGPYGGDVVTIAIDPLTPTTIYAGTLSGGVYKSTDSGGRWQQIFTGMTSSFAVDPVNPANLYMASGDYYFGIAKSTNGGTDWLFTGNGILGPYVTSFAIDPTNPSTMYASSSLAPVMYKSTNGGADWSPVNIGSSASINRVVIDSTNSSVIYAAGTGGTVFKSTNGGSSWSSSNVGLPDSSIVSFVINPSNPTTLFVGTSGSGIFKSSDGGATWSAVNAGLTAASVQCLAIDPSSASTIYAGTTAGFFKSTNGGTNWNQISTGFANNNIRSVAIDPADTTKLYIGTKGNGFYKSTNGGLTWSNSNLGLGIPVKALAIHPGNSHSLIAGTRGGGIFKTTDQGSNWTQINTGLPGVYVNAVAVDPTTWTTLYAGVDGGGLFKSIDGGFNWAPANGGIGNTSSIRPYGFVFDPITPTTVYAIMYPGGIYKSSDGGGNWNYLTNTVSMAFTIDPTSPTTLYAGTSSGGISKSENGGNSWTDINSGQINREIIALIAAPTTPISLYAATRIGLFKSIDGGASWSAINNGLTTLYVSTLAIDPATPTTLYAGTISGGIFKSTDGGGQWTEMNTGLSSFYLGTIAIDPVDPTTIYAGTLGGGVNHWKYPIVTTADPPAGEYNSSQSIVLTANKPATIYYTTDGTDPTSSPTRHIYSGGIPITSTSTLKFYGVDADNAAEAVVHAANYTIIATPPKVNLTVILSGTGSGIVHSSPLLNAPDINCSASACNEFYEIGTPVTLTSSANPDSYFANWSSCDQLVNGTCVVTMNSTRTITAEFRYDWPVVIGQSGYNGSIQEAYNSLTTGDDILRLKIRQYNENLDFNKDIRFALQGGCNADLSGCNGVSTLHGDMIISAGSVTVSNISIE